MTKSIFVLIPAYKPDDKILDLIDSLKQLGMNDIIVVRDGGGEEFDEIFNKIKSKNCILLVHEKNLGKGEALKTGFNYFYENFPDAVGLVTADADGQHAPDDIFKVANFLRENPANLVLGVRTFEKSIPFRSKFGNVLTQKIFYLLTGKKVSDTQTGLRGIPRKNLPDFVKLKGSQYEYEINMLASTRTLGIEISEVPIKTIYIDNNRSSHFNPILDSIKIYALLFRFSFSGIISFIVDYSLFALTMFLTANLAFSSYFSRGCSMFLNYSLNRNMVFCCSGNKIISFTKYFLTCLLSISISYLFIALMRKYTNFSVYSLKIFIEILLFFLNFYIQKKFIFKHKKQ